MSMYFDPDGRPIEMMEWRTLFETRRENGGLMRRTEVGDVSVSTVWIGLDHQMFGDGPPLFWETMIFGGDHDQGQWRYSSREEAFAGHERIVAALIEGRDP